MKTFTYEQVKDILLTVYETYDIANTSKFREYYLSNFQDAPPDYVVIEAQDKDIESYIF
jgi:hypothetical protein